MWFRTDGAPCVQKRGFVGVQNGCRESSTQSQPSWGVSERFKIQRVHVAISIHLGPKGVPTNYFRAEVGAIQLYRRLGRVAGDCLSHASEAHSDFKPHIHAKLLATPSKGFPTASYPEKSKGAS